MTMPAILLWTCHECGAEFRGSVEESAEHMRGHGHQVETWPDGTVAVDASDVPEMLLDGAP